MSQLEEREKFQERRWANQLTWYVAQLCDWAQGVEARLSANSDAIEQAVADLKVAESRISEKLDALESAAANGEDLSGPLADLRGEVATVGSIVPAPAPAPAEAPVDAPPAAPVEAAPAASN